MVGGEHIREVICGWKRPYRGFGPRPPLSIVVITVVNTVPQESNVSEPEVNSDFIDKSDPGPSKLENSDILRNLNNKLSHLEPSQQEELKQLMHEYEHSFPDIPTRTYKIYHDVIVEILNQ